MNTGEATIEWLYSEQLKVDKEWSTRTPTGFRWWADQHAQTIEVIGEAQGPAGDTAQFISVRTDFVRGIDLRGATAPEEAMSDVLDVMAQCASMFGLVHDRSRGTMTLCSLVRVHEAIAHWMNPLISMASVLQLHAAAVSGQAIAPELGGEDAMSGHPTSGVRPEPDELADVAETMVIPMGSGPSRWLQAEFEQAVEEHMHGPPSMMTSLGGAGFTAEFPHGSGSSLLQVNADGKHPFYGSGLNVLQSFPLGPKAKVTGPQLAYDMNAVELACTPFGYGFGTYLWQHGMLQFKCFLPNAIYRPGLLPSLFFSCAGRAREMSARLTGKEWSEEMFNPARTAAGILMGLHTPDDVPTTPRGTGPRRGRAPRKKG